MEKGFEAKKVIVAKEEVTPYSKADLSEAYDTYKEKLGDKNMSQAEKERALADAAHEVEEAKGEKEQLEAKKEQGVEDVEKQSVQERFQLRYKTEAVTHRDFDEASAWAMKKLDPHSPENVLVDYEDSDDSSSVRKNMNGYLTLLKAADLASSKEGHTSNKADNAYKNAVEAYRDHFIDQKLTKSDVMETLGFKKVFETFQKTTGLDLQKLQDEGKLAGETIGYMAACMEINPSSEYQERLCLAVQRLLEGNKLEYDVRKDSDVSLDAINVNWKWRLASPGGAFLSARSKGKEIQDYYKGIYQMRVLEMNGLSPMEED